MPTLGVPNTTTWDPLKAGSYQRSMVRRTDTSYITQRPKMIEGRAPRLERQLSPKEQIMVGSYLFVEVVVLGVT